MPVHPGRLCRLISQLRSTFAWPAARNLLYPQWRHLQPASAGFCYMASEIIYHAFGGPPSGLRLQVATPDDMYTHYWLRDSDDMIIDPTADQLGDPRCHYTVGRNARIMGEISARSLCLRRIMQKPRILGLLENAWSPAWAGMVWPRQSWLDALWSSRTGNRLRHLTNRLGKAQIWFDNTTPEVARTPNDKLPPNYQHVCELVCRLQPTAVVAFGEQAARVCRELQLEPLLIVPHPAYRVVTNGLYQQAGTLLRRGRHTGIHKLEQGRGTVTHFEPVQLY
jgi:hypothetical protein